MLSLGVLLPDLSGGGVEQMHLRLAPYFAAAGIDHRFVLARRSGALAGLTADNQRIDSLDARRQLTMFPRLVAYLRSDPPDVLIVNMEHMAVIAAAARAVSRAKTRIIVTQHNSLAHQYAIPDWQFRVLPPLFRRALASADAIVAVSEGVKGEMARLTGIDPARIQTIYNGIIDASWDARLDDDSATVAPPAVAGQRTIIAMGRLVPQKGFDMLIAAFARIAPQLRHRLVILGQGPLRRDLARQIDRANLNDRVLLPGFAANPLPMLRAADLFVLSSNYEGFGNVVVEALAAGTPVVSTDCDFGPAEILDHGRYGQLVPVGDTAALGRAMLSALRNPVDRDALIQRGRDYSVRRCFDQYVDLIQAVMRGRSA